VPGSVHRVLVQLAIRKIAGMGYRIVASDMNYHELVGTPYRLPPKIAAHQPDLLGVRLDPPIFCIGEAKSAGDVRTKHSMEQYRAFSSFSDCRVLVAIPESARGELDRALSDLHIPYSPVFECLIVPDGLLRL
jgi:hypothetical protein